MTNITCMIIIEDEESKVVIKRTLKHEETEGMANIGWCLGTEIASAICAISGNVASPEDIKKGLNITLEDCQPEMYCENKSPDPQETK